jgi:uncharacterized protein
MGHYLEVSMKLNLIRHVAALILLWPAAVKAGETEEALERARRANAEKDYATALTIYQRLAQDGEPQGMMSLGLMYQAGIGVERDVVRACDFYQKAAEKGLALAQHLLGDCYFQGGGRPLDYSQSKAWYEKAASGGDVKASCALGNLYMDGRGVPRDMERGMALCRKGAEAGDADAQADLAARYLSQNSPEAHAQAFDLLTKAVAQGHANAALDLGKMYWNGDSTGKNREAAVRFFLMAWKGPRGSEVPFLIGQYYFTQALDRERQQISKGPGLQAMYWLSMAYKVDPNADNRAQSMKLAQMLHGLAPNLTDALKEWLKKSNEPPTQSE